MVSQSRVVNIYFLLEYWNAHSTTSSTASSSSSSAATTSTVSTSAAAAATTVVITTTRRMRALSVRSKKGRRAFLLNNILSQSPEDDTNAALAVLLIRGECINAMLPSNVGVTAKAENAIIGLGEVHAALLAVNLFGGMDEGQLAHTTKGHADRDVLVPGALRIERRRVMMEGLPIAGVAVPIKSGADALLLDVEVLAEPINDQIERLGFGGILADEMGALVPRDPLGSLALALGLDLAHLLDELVVQGPVLLFAKELGDDDDVVVLQGAVEYLGPVAANMNAQIGTDQS